MTAHLDDTHPDDSHAQLVARLIADGKLTSDVRPLHRTLERDAARYAAGTSLAVA